MLGFATGNTYQATDLARRHTAVVDDARHGGAYIRDKDGTTLFLGLASDVTRQRHLAALAGDLLRLHQAVKLGTNDAAACGQFAWISVMDVADQAMFADAVVSPLLIAISGGSIEPLTTLLEDWRVTAEAWADEDLRNELLEPVNEPLADEEL